jgi:hypothetical protein
LNPQLTHGAAKLCQASFVDFAAGVVGKPVMAATITVEAAEQAFAFNRFAYSAETGQSALLGHEEAGLDLNVSVVHGDKQIPALTGHPFMR